MKIIHQFTRGGQVFFHDISMLWQVFSRVTLWFVPLWLGLTIACGWYFGDKADLSFMRTHAEADLYVAFGKPNSAVEVTSRNGVHRATADAFLNGYLYKMRWQDLKSRYLRMITYSGIAMGFVWFALIVYFGRKGRRQSKPKQLDGTQKTNVKAIRKKLRKQRLASDIMLDGLPLVKNSETQHMGIIGTTGTGKSVLMKKLMHAATLKNQRAIVYDKTGELTAQFYDPSRGDILLNPFDARMPAWNLWADCPTEPDFDAMAASLMPHVGHDPFWVNGARTIFAAIARQFKKGTSQPNLQDFLKEIYNGDPESMMRHLKGTEAEMLITKGLEKVTMSLRSIINTYTKSLRYIPSGADPFSIRDWVRRGEGWVFLTSRQNVHESISPLLTCWLDTAINALMCEAPNHDRRLWFFLDEVPTLHKIPSLGPALAEGRKYGACLVLGFQSIAQLSGIYNRDGAQLISSLLNTSFYFRQGDKDMASWASANLGEARMSEVNEGRTYGANTVRDGVSMNRQERMRRIATPDDMMSLPDRQCYVRLPGDYPICKLKLQIDDHPIISDAYVEKKETDSEKKSPSKSEVLHHKEGSIQHSTVIATKEAAVTDVPNEIEPQLTRPSGDLGVFEVE